MEWPLAVAALSLPKTQRFSHIIKGELQIYIHVLFINVYRIIDID